MRYLLDTDWAIEYLRANQRFVKGIADVLPFGVGISVVSLAELYEGVAAARDQYDSEQELKALVSRLGLLGVDSDIARIFGEERLRLRTEGRMIGDLDLLIAATALQHDLTLLTNNRRHFERIPNLVIESI